MDYLTMKLWQLCETELLSYRFKRKNGCFVRVVNDVMQNFAIEKVMSGRACRVEFAIIPLCLRIEKKYILGGVYSYNLKKFELAQRTWWDQWEYDKKSEKSMDDCVEEIIRYLKTYLFPLFQCANSCKMALPELIRVEKLFNDNRKVALKRDGIEDKGGFCTELNLLDNAKYYMAIKNGDYNFALKSHKAMLKQNLDSYQSAQNNSFITQEVLEERKVLIEKLRMEVALLEAGDLEYFQKDICENETYSRKILTSVI